MSFLSRLFTADLLKGRSPSRRARYPLLAIACVSIGILVGVLVFPEFYEDRGAMLCLPSGVPIIFVAPSGHPSQRAVTRTHEEVHAEQCRSLGSWNYYRTMSGSPEGRLSLEAPARCVSARERWERREAIAVEEGLRMANSGGRPVESTVEAFRRNAIAEPWDRDGAVGEVVGNLRDYFTTEELDRLDVRGAVLEYCGEFLDSLDDEESHQGMGRAAHGHGAGSLPRP